MFITIVPVRKEVNSRGSSFISCFLEWRELSAWERGFIVLRTYRTHANWKTVEQGKGIKECVAYLSFHGMGVSLYIGYALEMGVGESRYHILLQA